MNYFATKRFQLSDWWASVGGLGGRTHHGKVTLPLDTALAVAEGAGTLQAVAAALAAVEGHMIVRPGDAAGEAGAHVLAQLLDGQHVVHADLQRAAHQVRQGGGQTQRVVPGNSGEKGKHD